MCSQNTSKPIFLFLLVCQSFLFQICVYVQSIAKMLIIIAIASGVNFFEYIGKEQPVLWQWCVANKVYACLVVFFGSNMFEGILISTGAFELFFNGKNLQKNV